MQANEQQIKLWNELRERKDAKAISKIIGLAPQNVSKMIKTGIGTISELASINKFYKEKKKIKESLEQDDDLN